MKTSIPLAVLGSLFALWLPVSCESPRVTGNPVLVNPERASPEIGGTDEILEVSQRAITSLLNARPPRESGPPERIVLDRIVNNTGYPEYDEKILYNRFLAQLTQVARGRYVFLDRRAVSAEREAQARGVVTPGATQGPLQGADLVLTIELRTLRGAGTTTIQYAFQLTALDGSVVWADTVLFKKRV